MPLDDTNYQRAPLTRAEAFTRASNRQRLLMLAADLDKVHRGEIKFDWHYPLASHCAIGLSDKLYSSERNGSSGSALMRTAAEAIKPGLYKKITCEAGAWWKLLNWGWVTPRDVAKTIRKAVRA